MKCETPCHSSWRNTCGKGHHFLKKSQYHSDICIVLGTFNITLSGQYVFYSRDCPLLSDGFLLGSFPGFFFPLFLDEIFEWNLILISLVFMMTFFRFWPLWLQQIISFQTRHLNEVQSRWFAEVLLCRILMLLGQVSEMTQSNIIRKYPCTCVVLMTLKIDCYSHIGHSRFYLASSWIIKMNFPPFGLDIGGLPGFCLTELLVTSKFITSSQVG